MAIMLVNRPVHSFDPSLAVAADDARLDAVLLSTT